MNVALIADAECHISCARDLNSSNDNAYKSAPHLYIVDLMANQLMDFADFDTIEIAMLYLPCSHHLNPYL